MSSDNANIRLYRLKYIIFEIMEYIKSIHFNENHWLRLKPFSGGMIFRTDLQRQTLEFLLDTGVRMEVEVHPSGRSLEDCDNIDCMVQEISIRAWYPTLNDPVVYKWEYGNPNKLKKEDKDWIEEISLLKSIEVVLEDVMKHFPS